MVMLLEQMDVLYLQDHLPESMLSCRYMWDVHAKCGIKEREENKRVRDYFFFFLMLHLSKFYK